MLALAFAALASMLEPGAQNRAPQITVLGDSITRDWPLLMIGQGHYELRNKFASGAMSDTCYAQWKYNTRDYDADVLVSMCGVNDMKGAANWTPLQTYTSLVRIYNEAYAAGVEVWILSVLPAQYRGNNNNPPNLQPAEIVELNAMLSQWVAEHPGSHYVDLYPLFLSDPGNPTSYRAELYDYEAESRDPDGDGVNAAFPIYLHPSALGDAVIAEALLDAWGW